MFKHLYQPNTFKDADLKNFWETSSLCAIPCLLGFTAIPWRHMRICWDEISVTRPWCNVPCKGLGEKAPLDNSLECTVVLLDFLTLAQTAVHGASEQKIWKSRSLLGSLWCFTEVEAGTCIHCSFLLPGEWDGQNFLLL